MCGWQCHFGLCFDGLPFPLAATAAPHATNTTNNTTTTIHNNRYAESRVVAQFNEANPNMRVSIAGSTVHNMDSFLEEVDAAVRQ